MEASLAAAAAAGGGASAGAAHGACLAVAVSGGPDSMALAALLAAWAAPRRARLRAITVDHLLRPESGAEAALVAGRLRALGLEHVTAVAEWPGGCPPPASRRQAAGRAERFRLLSREAAAAGARLVLLGHHAGDSVETALGWWARASGLRGLAGIAPAVALGDLVLVRPLLSVPKARLLATAGARRVAHVTDPSNVSEAYDRVRVRAAVAAMAGTACGPSEAALLRVVEHARVVAGDMDAAARAVLAAAVVRHDARGYALLAPAQLLAPGVPPGVARLVIRRILMAYGGREFGARHDGVERAHAALAAGAARRGITAGGCVLRSLRPATAAAAARGAPDTVLVCREPRVALQDPLRFAPVAPGAGVLWDGRFSVRMRVRATAVGVSVPPLELRAFSEPLRMALRARPGGAALDDRMGVPHAVKVGLPAVCARDGALLALPHIGYSTIRGVAFDATFTPLRPLGAAAAAAACEY